MGPAGGPRKAVGGGAMTTALRRKQTVSSFQ